MIKIGIELNNIVRNINYQVMKYYKKDINPEFDETTISSNRTSIIEEIPFENSQKRNEFTFIDYPYEIFGCARVMERNLSTKINDWLIQLSENEDEEYDVNFFSLRENDLSIPSTYYFLSKIATRVRTMYFPTKEENLWDKFDIIITTNKEIVDTKPEGKIVVLIKKEDNLESVEKSDYSFDSLSNVLDDNNFIENSRTNETTENESTSVFGRIKKWFK